MAILKFECAARAEKAATFHLLECLYHLDVMRGYIELGFTSLYDYVHRGLEYSETQSYDRIAAVRLAFQVERVKEGLRDGALSLTVVSKIATHARQEKLKTEEVEALVQTAAHKSVREVEKMIAATRPEGAAPIGREALRPLTATHSRLEVTVDEEFEALLMAARELSHDPTLSISAVLKTALKTYVEKKRREKGAIEKEVTEKEVTEKEVRSTGKSPNMASLSASTSALTRPPSGATGQTTYISVKKKRLLWARSDNQCEHVNPLTNVRCTSRQSLQVDHKTARVFGGTNHLQNLQYLCATHNRVKGAG